VTHPDDPAQAAAQVIAALGHPVPRVALQLGSGFSPLVAALKEAVSCSYAALPGFPRPTVAGHAGQLVIGRLAGSPVLVLAGRAHLYEGYSAREVGFPMRVLAQAGVTTVVLTNAAGALAEDLQAGDVVVLRDHLNLPGFAGAHPLVGTLGERFLALHDAYDSALRAAAQEACREAGLRAREGVYAMVAGPSYETLAECHFLRQIGADVVGMSTVPEVIVARQQGLRVCALSLVTNRCGAGDPLSHQEVLAACQAALPRLTVALGSLVQRAGAA
jgi:purine-nucleoside phosphorylase